MILRHNARHPEVPTPLPQWITQSPDNYATIKRTLPESKTDRIYIYDMDLDAIHGMSRPYTIRTTLLQNPSPKLTSSAQRNNKTSTTSVSNSEKDITVSDSTRHNHVHTKKCGKHHLYQRQNDMATTSKTTARKRLYSFNTTTNRANHTNDRQHRRNNGMSPSTTRRPRCHQRIHPTYEDDDYIPLMSAIALKKKKGMFFLPVEFNTVKIDALVDSDAYIYAISERDAEKFRQNASQCIINKAPPPPFKVQYANAELEPPLATYTLRFKNVDYTFEETFIVMNQTSFAIK